MELKDILLTILRDMSNDIEAFGYIDSKSYLDGAEAMLEDYITIKLAKAQYRELVDLGTKYNGPKKVFLDHYEYRYRFLKNVIESENINE